MKDTHRILLAPDPVEATGGVEVDPLSGAAAGVDTSFPLIAPDRIVRFKLAKLTVEAGKENPNAKVLTFKFKTEKDVAAADGKKLHSGFPVTTWISLTPTEGKDGKEPYTVDNIRRNCALFLKAIGKPDMDMRELRDHPERFEGEVVDCKVGIRKGKGGYSDSNTLTFVLPA